MIENLPSTYKNAIFATAVGLALVIIFLLPGFHPDVAVRSFKDKQPVLEQAEAFLDAYGYSGTELFSGPFVSRDEILVEKLQREYGRFFISRKINDDLLNVIPAYQWKTEFGGTTPESFQFTASNREFGIDFGDRSAFEFTHTQSAGILAFRNNLPDEELQTGYFLLRTQEHLPEFTAQVDSIQLPVIYEVDIDRTSPQWETRGDSLTVITPGTDFFYSESAQWLGKTVWGSREQKSETIGYKVDEDETTVEVTYIFAGIGNDDTDVKLLYKTNGILKEISVDWKTEATARSYKSWVEGIGVSILVLMGFVILIILIRRFYARLLDTSSAYADALLGMLLIMFAILAPEAVAIVTGNVANWWEPLAKLAASVASAVFVGILFYALALTGLSVSHESASSKVVSLNLVRRGFWLNKPVGKSIIWGLTAGTIAYGFVSLLIMVFPNLLLVLDTQTLKANLEEFTQLLSRAAFSLIAVYYIIFGLVLTCAMAWYNRGRNWKTTSIVLFIFMFFSMFYVFDVDGLIPRIIMNAIPALIFVAVYRYIDALALVFAFIAMLLWGGFVTGFIPHGWFSYYALVYPAMLGGLLFLGMRFSSLGKEVYEIPEYVPEYILERSRRERIEREFELARQVQQQLLPAKAPQITGLEIKGLCKPAFEIGGDYYDFITIDEHKTAVLIGDVSGKGVQAAFYMTLVKGFVMSLSREISNPAALMTRVNALFRENAPRGTFITMLYGIYDAKNATFSFVRLGHEPLLFVNAKGVTSLKPAGMPLGMTEGEPFEKNLKQETVTLQENDTIILFTDGVTETRNRKGDFLGEERIEALFKDTAPLSAEAVMNKLVNAVQKFRKDQPQHDDVTIITMFKKQ